MKIVPGFIFASSAALTSPFVSGLSATWTLTTSPRDTASAGRRRQYRWRPTAARSQSPSRAPRCRSAADPGRRSGGSRSRRSCRTPAARRIISCPMLPTPSRTSVRPKRPCAFEYSFLFQLPARSSATLSGMRRSSESSRPNASSATAIAFLPGQLRHVDAARGRARDVDRVVAGAGADDQREPSGVEHRGRAPSSPRTTSTSAPLAAMASRQRRLP